MLGVIWFCSWSTSPPLGPQHQRFRLSPLEMSPLFTMHFPAEMQQLFADDN